MDDKSIVALYWNRSEAAIAETAGKYGHYCYHIAYNILVNREDADESVNDTYLAAWNAIPPRRPAVLSTFLGKITRNLSIDRWRKRSAEKRGGGEMPLVLEELEECVSGEPGIEETEIQKETAALLNRFLDRLPETERNVFLRRYWYMESVAEIAKCFGLSQARVSTMLFRTRGKLRRMLEKEEAL